MAPRSQAASNRDCQSRSACDSVMSAGRSPCSRSPYSAQLRPCQRWAPVRADRGGRQGTGRGSGQVRDSVGNSGEPAQHAAGLLPVVVVVNACCHGGHEHSLDGSQRASAIVPAGLGGVLVAGVLRMGAGS
jgi:hypothetical protein